MAYALGFLYADGSVYRSARGHYVNATSTDKWIIVQLKTWLQSSHSIITIDRFGNRKARFVLRIGNKELYADLLRLGMYPNKSLTVRMPKVPQSFLPDFIRGYFDGDGCVSIYRSKGIRQEIILRKLSVIFTSGSKLFLEGLLKALRAELLLKQTKVYESHRSFQLRFATADSVTLFGFLYKDAGRNLFFVRKSAIFQEYFKLRPQRIDKSVLSALRCLDTGHVAK